MKTVYLTLISLVLALLVSCSSPQEEAKKKLQALNIEPTGISLIAQAKEGNAENVSLLITAGVPADSLGEKGYPALSWAAAKGHTDVVKVLLAAGVDKNRLDKDGDSALLSSVKMKKTDTAKVLLAAGAKTDVVGRKKGWTALRLAVMDKNEDLVRTLVQAGADIIELNEVGNSILMKYMEVVTPEIAHILIDASSLDDLRDIRNKWGDNTLQVAMLFDRSDVLALIINKGADINAEEWGGGADQRDNTPLKVSFARDAVKCFDVLMQNDVDIKYKNEHGSTVMHNAAFFLNDKGKAIIPKLVAAGADINAKNNRGATPIFSTVNGAYFNHKEVMAKEVIRALIEAGADVNVKDNHENTVLSDVILNEFSGFEDVVKMLKEAGASS